MIVKVTYIDPTIWTANVRPDLYDNNSEISFKNISSGQRMKSCLISKPRSQVLVDSLLRLFTGGNGYINDYPMGRFLRDAKLYEIGAGTSEVRRMIIGRAFNAMFK